LTERNKILFIYLLSLFIIIGHVFEEIWGGFRGLLVMGTSAFLLTNWLLLFIPFMFFYFILLEKRWAYYAGAIYSFLLILNGTTHIILALVTGQYFNLAAGAISGIAMVILGIILSYLLIRHLRKTNA